MLCPLPKPRIKVKIWVCRHEPHQRRSRMVEISLSGSGEGSGWITAPGYSTGAFWRTRGVGWTCECGSGCVSEL